MRSRRSVDSANPPPCRRWAFAPLWATCAAVAALAMGAPARADYYWALAIGEKHFTSVEDEDYRAERTAITQCIAEFEPALCEVLEVRSLDRDWQAEVVGTKGFFAADRKDQARADRSALSACRAQRSLSNCRVERRTQSKSQEGGASERGGVPRLEDLFGR